MSVAGNHRVKSSKRRGRRSGNDFQSTVKRRRRPNTLLEALEPRALLAGDIVISELMAANTVTLADSDGHYSDWVELHNTTALPISLNGYYLTDKDDDLDQWQFPNVTLPADGYLVVFASGKDRRVAGSELHTNFKLSDGGEYLALVKPDLSIEFEYNEFPAMEENISYGIAPGFAEDVLINTGATGKFTVPTAASPVGDWRVPGFNDTAWQTAQMGVGYQTQPTTVNSTLVGYWKFDDTTADASGNNHPAAFNGAGPGYAADTPSQIGTGKSLSLTGAALNYAQINPLDISESAVTISMWFKTSVQGRGFFTAGQGNLGVGGKDRELYLVGSNVGARLQGGQVAEQIQSSGKNYSDGAWHHIAYVYQAGQTTQRIYIDGAAQEVASGPSQSSSLLTGQDRIILGYAAPAATDWWQGNLDDLAIWNTALTPTQIAEVAAGVSPNELQAFGNEIATDVSTPMFNVNSSAYLRVPFNVASTLNYDDLTLQIKYDDGFIAYLNGTEIARRNAPASPAWNSQATATNPNGQAVKFETIDVSSFLGSLQNGPNVLAIHGLNQSSSNKDFLISARLIDEDVAGLIEQHFATPTPGGVNNLASALTSEPIFSQTSSIITGATQITLTSSTPGASIYYTTNGSLPSQSTNLYTAPITISTTTQLRARAFRDGLAPSNVSTQIYTLAAANALNFSSNLPVIIVNTGGGTFNGDTLTPVTAHFLEDPGNRTTITGLQDVAMRAGMRYRGQSSQGFPKHQYAFETWGEVNDDRDYSILGMPEESDWIIYGPYADKAEIQNAFVYELSNEIGDYAVRTQYVEMFINTDGTLQYDPSNAAINDYAGLYIFMEKIKADPNRVNINKLESNENSGIDITGGYIFSKDKNDPDGSVCNDCVTSTQSGQFHIVEPDYVETSAAQRTYLENYIKQMEAALYGPNFTDPVVGYNAYLDPQTFANHYLLVELAKNIDGYRISTFYNKDRDGKIKMGPVWDYNLSMSNANYLTGWSASGWYFNLLGTGDKPFLDRLFQDPNFAQLFVDSYEGYRDDLWSTDRLLGKIDSHIEEIYEGATRDHARWGRLGVYDWPNIYFGQGDAPQNVTHPARTYRDEVQMVRQFMHDRLLWMDSQFIAKPKFSQVGGDVTAGTQITLTGPANATIYYTLDGSDPRLPGGGIKPGAVAYAGPITINANTKVTARAKNNTVTADLKDDWSGAATAVYVVDAPDLILSEIMYNPLGPSAGSPYSSDDYEFVEVTNVGATPLNLNGYKFTKGIDVTLGNVTLNPGQSGVIVKNTAGFASRYPGITPIGTFTGVLDNGGEDLQLVDNIGVKLFDGKYEDDWQPHTDGNGFSLVTTYQSPGGGSLYNLGDASDKWRASQQTGGNPGTADTGVQTNSVVINEIVSNGADFIELYNTTGSAINVGGWYLSDDSTNLTKYQIAAGTTIAAGGYLVFTEASHFGNAGNPGSHVQFGLSELGEAVFLSSSGIGGQAGGYRVSEDFGAADPGVATGRYIKSTGKKDFVLLASSTPNAANAQPVIGSVVITEIMYHPKENVLWLPPQTGAQIKDEFIEIQNRSAAPVDISGWKMTEGVSLTVPAGQTLLAGERALIVPIDPTAFRTKYAIPAAVKIYGPYTGNLDDGGEQLELARPGTPVGGETPYIRVDRITYDDDAPWSAYADGVGSSLSRTDIDGYGNVVGNWDASHVGGTPGAANTFIDLTPPTQVSSVTTAQTGIGTADPRTNVSWTAASDPQSGIAYYNVYRRGSSTVIAKATAFHVGASTTLQFADNTVMQGPVFEYQVAAVNNDGIEGPRSAIGVIRPGASDDAYDVVEDTNLVTTLSPDIVQFIPEHSSWNYLVANNDKGTTWRNDGVIDLTGWGSGAGELGYGDTQDTLVPFVDMDPGLAGDQRNATTYFRRIFNITDLASYTTLAMRMKRDDVAVIWINGVERAMSGDTNPARTVGSAPMAWNQYGGVVAGDDGNSFNVIANVDPSWFREGSNTIAVEVHQESAGSSDISFDLIFEGSKPRRSGVLSNDSDGGNPPITAIKLTDPPASAGQITQFNSNGTFTFVPAQNFTGTTSFMYKVLDGQVPGVDSVPATVTINVTPVNDAPVANAGGPYTVSVGQNLTLNGSATDADHTQGQLTFAWDLDYDGVSFQADANGAAPTVSFATTGSKTIALRVTDPLGGTSTATATVQVNGAGSTIMGRHVFYNQSKFDANDATANASDDAAIATDKVALLPGGTASFANYTSFNRGLNGIMVDIAGLPAGPLSASDFDFKVGNTDTPSAWAALAGVPTISVRPGAGVSGSSRVTLVWPTGAAIKQWLQVTVKANGNTGLTNPDVFYFGNAVGESGNVAGDYSVSITDELLARNNPVGIIPGTTVINRFDYNRDGTVSVVDQLLSRNNITTVATRLRQITVPSALSGSGLVAQGLDDSDIARGLAASSLAGSSSTSGGSSSGSSTSSSSRLQPQALSAAYGEGESLLGKRRTAPAANVDNELLELLANGK